MKLTPVHFQIIWFARSYSTEEMASSGVASSAPSPTDNHTGLTEDLKAKCSIHHNHKEKAGGNDSTAGNEGGSDNDIETAEKSGHSRSKRTTRTRTARSIDRSRESERPPSDLLDRGNHGVGTERVGDRG